MLTETRRAQAKLHWPPHLIESFEAALRSTFPEALVSGYEHLVPAATNDPKDQHVLAAAIHADAEVILTFNLRDFPDEALAPWRIEAMHPQDYLLTHYEEQPSPFDYVVVDEAQDLGVAQLRFLAALAGDRADGLFFAGDLGQRIFQPPFSWKALGVDVRGRSYTLRINYRTSHQIRRHADRLLGPELADVDGIVESRRGTMSVFNGPDPVVRLTDRREAEVDAVAKWICGLRDDGVAPEEMAHVYPWQR